MSILNLIPDVGLSERWEWKTDILTSYNGTEQRISLRERPRVSQTASFSQMNQEDRRAIFLNLMTNIQNVFDTPLWAYSSRITQESLIGVSRLYFDPASCPVSSGGIIILINPTSGDTQSYFVNTIYVDGCDIIGSLSATVTVKHLAVLGFKSIIEDKSSLEIQSITSESNVLFSSWIEPIIVRSGNLVTLNQYDSLPVLDKIYSSGMKSKILFKKNIIDPIIGLRTFSSGWNRSIIEESLVFNINRVLDTDNLDFWRLFIDTVKGAAKSFLLSTRMEDLTLFSSLTQNGTSIIINEYEHVSLLHSYDSFKRIEIVYSDNSSSYHTISTSVNNGTDATLTITPNLPNDPKVSDVLRISYLLKGHMGDTIVWRHGHTNSEISIEFLTTDQG